MIGNDFSTLHVFFKKEESSETLKMDEQQDKK